MKNQKGITLIALIITIIVMVILAGVVISTALLDGGVLQQSRNAKKEHEAGQEAEKVRLAVTSAALAGLDVITEENLTNALDKNFGTGNYTLNSKDEYFELTVDGLGIKYQIYPEGKIEETKIATGVTDEQGEYYLKMFQVLSENIESTEEEYEEFALVAQRLTDEGKITSIEIEYSDKYYDDFIYIDGYIICYSSDYREEKEVSYVYLVEKDDKNYNKMNDMLKEKLEILNKLKSLLMGYTYTNDINYVELEANIKSKLGEEADFWSKAIDDWRVELYSKVDENYKYKLYIYGERSEGNTYTITGID